MLLILILVGNFFFRRAPSLLKRTSDVCHRSIYSISSIVRYSTSPRESFIKWVTQVLGITWSEFLFVLFFVLNSYQVDFLFAWNNTKEWKVRRWWAWLWRMLRAENGVGGAWVNEFLMRHVLWTVKVEKVEKNWRRKFRSERLPAECD